MKVRFAPGPTGSLHVGDALGAIVNRNIGGTMPLHIDDTGSARNVPGGDEAILEDLRWLGIEWERPTLERFRELRERTSGALDAAAAKAIVRELKAVGGDLRAVRRALTGRESGPELWSIVAALSREETLRRVDGAL